MDKPNRIKHISKRTLDNLFYGRENELSEPVKELMDYESHLTEEQAEETLKLFSNIDNAITVANYFFSKRDIRRTFPTYNNYLNTIYKLIYFPEEKPCCSEVESIFNEEVIVKGGGLLPKVLATPEFSSMYRDDPWDNSHQQEHFASQDNNSEVNSELENKYINRRLETGL